MIWLSHKKYTQEYVQAQLAEIGLKVRRETRRMVYTAIFAVAFMVAVQATCLFELLSV